MIETDAKILLWDIETTPMTTYVFSMQHKYRNYIPYHQIIQPWNIITISWKELGAKKVESASLIDFPKRFKKDHKDDSKVIEAFAKAARNADILVAHNGDKFDMKHLNTRLMYHGQSPLPKLLSVDTLKEAKKVFELPSYSLNNLADFFHLDAQKTKTDFQMWVDCVNGDASAIHAMDKYCQQDIVVLEEVYMKLRPFMKAHPNIATDGSKNCPRCNSNNVHVHKRRAMANSGIKRIQYQCQDCGKYYTGALAIKDDTGETLRPLSKA